MPGGSKTQSQSQSSNTVNPAQMAQYQANYNTAQQNGSQLAQPYTGQLTAGFTPAQVQAQGILSGVGTNPQYTQNLTGATNAVQGILGNPVNGTINPQAVNASTVAGTDLSPYMNQYQNDVINSTMGQFDLLNKQQLNNTNQSATAAGAFGGSRSGVADALTNQNNATAEAPILAGLNASNFTNAQNMAATDAATKNAMGQFNSTQNVNAQNQSVQNQLASQTQGLNAANEAANLTGQNFQMAANQGGLLSNIGNQQQQQQQTEMSNAYNNWLQGKQLTLDQQQLLNQALGIIPLQQTTNSNSTSKTQTNPGAAGILGGIGSLALSAALPGSGAILGGLAGGSSLLGGLFGGGAASQTPFAGGLMG